MTRYPDWTPRLTLAERVKQLRTERGWSLRDFPHVSASTVSRIERGLYDVKLSVIVDLARDFGLTVPELLSNVDLSQFESEDTDQ